MKVVFVLFDSLNRLALGAYGGTSVPTPNFDRFARERAVTFDGHYVGSLPCMPARRDMHTGRLNFMHRSWGPLEPFDNSCFELLTRAGVHTHLVSDHLHYFEDGGGGYHTRFKTYDFVRGQEYDPWIAMAKPPVERLREAYDARHYDFDAHPKRLQGAVNREVVREEAEYPGPQCFARAFEFPGPQRRTRTTGSSRSSASTRTSPSTRPSGSARCSPRATRARCSTGRTTRR